MRPGAQFSRDDFQRTGGYNYKDQKSKYDATDHYTYHAPKVEGEDPKGARVSVTKPSNWYDVTDRYHTYHDEGSGNPVLFNVTHDPGYVSMMDSSPEHRAQAMTLLGIAATHHKTRYGAMPESDESLSAQAAPIVRRLASKGLVKPPHMNEGIQANNLIERDPKRLAVDLIMSQPYGQTDLIPPHMVDAGRRTMREAMRSKPKGSPQAGYGPRYEQTTLPLPKV